MNDLNATLEDAQRLSRQHYENFPVAPFFLPKDLRSSIALIYTFARMADDRADEGSLLPTQRLQQLDHLIDQLPDGKTPGTTPFFKTLNQTIAQHQLPCSLFHDLIYAFKQDVVKNAYQTHEEVLDYCRYSANPIGRLLLFLTQQNTEQNIQDSDRICTALQLINFLQDWYSDWTERQRIYIPQEDLKKFQVLFDSLNPPSVPQGLEAALNLQWQRAYQPLLEGAKLGSRLKGRFGFDIRLIIQGGFQVLKRLKKRRNPFERPVLNKLDWLNLVIHSVLKKS